MPAPTRRQIASRHPGCDIMLMIIYKFTALFVGCWLLVLMLNLRLRLRLGLGLCRLDIPVFHRETERSRSPPTATSQPLVTAVTAGNSSPYRSLTLPRAGRAAIGAKGLASQAAPPISDDHPTDSADILPLERLGIVPVEGDTSLARALTRAA